MKKLVYKSRWPENPNERFIGNVNLPEGKGLSHLEWKVDVEQILEDADALKARDLVNAYNGVAVGTEVFCKVVGVDYKLRKWNAIKKKYTL